MKVVTRIAPSPTGVLHVGTARSALFNYLFAKKHNGDFIIRIEDTDKERSKKEFELDIIEGLHALGLQEDALFRQSEREEVYSQYIDALIKDDKAYISKEPSKSNPNETVEVVRLRNPNKTVTFTDEIRGEISFDTAELKDFVIARSVSEPLYHLAVVIDDALMKVSHVIRGEDHISNTPRQILLQEALGFARPIYAHMPLILGQDRSKLSKRHGAVSVNEYLKNYTGDAIVNYLALLGWNPGTDQEIFSLDELIQAFDISKIQKSGAIFSSQKLNSINAHYLKQLPPDKFRSLVIEHIPTHIIKSSQYSESRESAILSTLKERAENIDQIKEMLNSGQLDFFVSEPKLDVSKISWKDETEESARLHLCAMESAIEALSATSFDADAIKDAVWEYATEHGRGSVLWPFRYALTGEEKSPDPFIVAAALGKEETSRRINSAIHLLEQ